MSLTLTGEKAYLALPVSSYAKSKRLWVFCEGKAQDTVDLRLDYTAPEYCAYYPIGRYKGRDITLKTVPEMELKDWQTDTPDYHAAEVYPFRPHWHFTPRFGWMNDPNGLVAYTSQVTGRMVYHLFYQYNPYDTVWGNMHWGHAVSEDLLHWEEQPVALSPDGNGTIYSGCGLVDERNLTGLQEGEEKAILLYYTCAGGENGVSKGRPYTQCLAYSTDGGRNFCKYQGNPVVPNVSCTNRDPKVIWCQELGRYVMALYVSYIRDSEYMILTSEDLIHWEKLQNLWMEGDIEFPDLYPLAVSGEPEKVYWVFTGCRQTYMLCECSPEEGFRIVQGPQPLVYGRNAQAPQTFSDIPDGRRICITWHRDIAFPTPYPFYSQQSIPYEMTLQMHRNTYYLAAWPVKEIASLYQSRNTYRQIEAEGDKVFRVQMEPGAYDIFLRLPPDENGRTAISLFGGVLTVDARNNTVTVKSGSVPSLSMPLSVTGVEKSLRILVDRCSLELFSDRGTSMMPVSFVCDYNLTGMEISSRDGIVVEELNICRLQDRKRDGGDVHA